MSGRTQPDDVYARIRKMLPLARTVIAERGIAADLQGDIDDEFEAAAAGVHCPGHGVRDEQIFASLLFHRAVFTLGMAVGLLLDRSLFEEPAATTRPRSSTRRPVTRRARPRRRMAQARKGGA